MDVGFPPVDCYRCCRWRTVARAHDQPTALTGALYTFRARQLPATTQLDALYTEVRRTMLGS
jgi:hypothetical protein